MWIEVFGIVSSIIILVSMCFNPQTKLGNILLRSINLMGSICFIIYGLLLPAYATIFMNSCALVINSIYLVKILRASK